jgi:hypothetical protein
MCPDEVSRCAKLAAATPNPCSTIKREVMLEMASRFIEERRWPFSFPANTAVYAENEQFKFGRRHQSSVWT